MYNEDKIKFFFGVKLFDKFRKVFDECCGGISKNGNPNLVLNQQGNWINSNGNIQILLSELPVYESVANALANGAAYGSWFFNTLNNTINKAWNYIQSFSAGVSPISFVSDGADGWDLAIVVNPPSVQLPSGATITGVDLDCIFFQAGVGTDLAIGVNYTADDVFNTGANGAGLYEVRLKYNISNGSFFETVALFVVNATDTILHYYKHNGVVVSNVNGLTLTVTANVEQNTYLTIDWLASDGISPTLVGSGSPDTITIPATTQAIGQKVTLSSEYADYPNTELFSGFSISII